MSKIDQREQVWAITEYFSRDRLAKSAASLGMALSALEEEDVYHFTQRLLIEAQKYKDDKKIAELINKLKKAYYGNGELPSTENRPVPLYYLRAEKLEQGEVRIRGIYIDGYLTEVLTWGIWQQLKIESMQNVLEISSELLSEIEKKIEIRKEVYEYYKDTIKLVKNTQELWIKLDPAEYVLIEETNEKTIFETNADFMTWKVDSGNGAERKFKPFVGDFFANLQIMVSSALNTDNWNDVVERMIRVAGYIMNPLIAGKNGKTIIIKARDTTPLIKFIEVTKRYRVLNSLKEIDSLTISEKILILKAFREAHATLEFIISKLFSICTHIMARKPKPKTFQWEEIELE